MIQGNRVRLRPFRAADLPTLRRWFSDPDLMRSWAVWPPLIREDAFETDLDGRFATFEGAGYFAIEGPDGALVGRADFEDLDPVDRSTEVMVMIGEPGQRGLGFGEDAMRALLGYLFRGRDLHRVTLTVLTTNEPAIRLYERLGFRREGLHRAHAWIDGERHDQYRYGLLRDEFRD